MVARLRVLTALCAFALPAVIVAGCGGVPGNAVATVNDTTIEKSTFDHWMTVAAKSGGQGGQGSGQVPVPPDYTACIAQKKKTAAKPAKGQKAPTDAQLKAQCDKEYDALRDQVMQLLISFEWIEGEAADKGLKVSDAEVSKQFDKQKKESFPKEADYAKFLKDSGQTQDDILLRVRLDLLSNKIRDSIVKGKDKVSAAQIEAYYDKNAQQFATPESREARVVLTKTKAEAEKAKQALEDGQSWKSVAEKYSIDDASKTQGGKLPAISKGQQEKALDDALFSAKKGQLEGPVKTQFGYYVFEVSKINDAKKQTLAEATPAIKQALSSQGQQKALDTFVKDFRKRWKEDTECREGYVTSDCKDAPEPKPTTQAPPGTAPQGGQQQQPQQGGQAVPPTQDGTPQQGGAPGTTTSP